MSDQRIPRLHPARNTGGQWSNPLGVDTGLLVNEMLQTQAIESAQDALLRRRDDATKRALRETDWEETPIVDLVWSHPIVPETSPADVSTFARPEIELTVRRYSADAPPLSESGVDGRACEVQRVTRPLWERIRREYEF